MLQQQLDLGADPIASRHDDRMFVRAQIIGRGKEPERACELALFLRALHELSDIAYECGRLTNVHAGLLVGVALGRFGAPVLGGFGVERSGVGGHGGPKMEQGAGGGKQWLKRIPNRALSGPPGSAQHCK